jgi:hypothetical protein
MNLAEAEQSAIHFTAERGSPNTLLREVYKIRLMKAREFWHTSPRIAGKEPPYGKIENNITSQIFPCLTDRDPSSRPL